MANGASKVIDQVIGERPNTLRYSYTEGNEMQSEKARLRPR